MGFDLKVMKEAEQKYTYRQSRQISNQCGLVGYLRADMDTNGKGFFSTWNDCRKDLKTEEFKAEFDDMINTYREKGSFLADRSTLGKFCHEVALQYERDNRSFGVRVDSADYAYLCRLNPYQGEYNLYCYCYKKEWLDGHIRNAEKGIRFITPEYKEKFRLKDGDSIRITYSDGERSDKLCRYIDEYHVEVGNTLYHICEFAERMERGGAKVIPLRSDLPDVCYAIMPGTDELIIIKHGESGYYRCECSTEDKAFNRALADDRNASLGVGKAQIEAMLAGSMFGWDVPAADPKNYDGNGKLLHNPKDRGDAR
jgi:hypothetical protein